MSNLREKLIYLSSVHSKSDSGDEDFQWSLSERLQHVQTIQLLNVSIPWSWTCIDQYNQTLNFTAGGATYNALLPAGNYDSSSLLTALKTAFEGVGIVGFTVTVGFSDVTNKLSIKPAGSILTINSTSTCQSIIGLTVGSSFTINDGISGILPKPINLLPLDHLNIQLPQLISSVGSAEAKLDGELSICDVVPLSGYNPWDLVSLSSQTTLEHRVQRNVNTFNQFTVRLTDASQYTPDSLYDKTFPFHLVFKITYLPNQSDL